MSGADGEGATPTRGERTRRRIIDAGREAFAAKGFHATRVDDIVGRAAISHGTFYLYFASKEDLFTHLVAEAADELSRLVVDLPLLDEQHRAELRAWLERFMEVYDRSGQVLRTWIETELSDEPTGRMGAELLGRLADAVTDRMDLPAEDGLDPAIASLALVTLIERLTYLVSSGQVRGRRDQVVDTLCQVVVAVADG